MDGNVPHDEFIKTIFTIKKFECESVFAYHDITFRGEKHDDEVQVELNFYGKLKSIVTLGEPKILGSLLHGVEMREYGSLYDKYTVRLDDGAINLYFETGSSVGVTERSEDE